MEKLTHYINLSSQVREGRRQKTGTTYLNVLSTLCPTIGPNTLVHFTLDLYGVSFQPSL